MTEESVTTQQGGAPWRYRLLAVFVVVLSLVVLSACGSDSSSDSGGGDAGSEAAGTDVGSTGQKAPPPPKGTCTADACNIYEEVPWSAYEETTVAVLHLAPIEGILQFDEPVEECVSAHGAEVREVNAEGDPAKVSSSIQDFLSSDVDAIFGVGLPIDRLGNLMRQADQKGVPVIGWALGEPQRGVVTFDVDQTQDGREAARYLIDELGESISVTMINDPVNDPLSARNDGVKEVMAEYPDVDFDYQGVNSLNIASGQQAAAAALQSNPDLDGFIGGYADFATGEAAAVGAAGSDAIVIGMDGTPSEFDNIRSGGPQKATIADPKDAGAQLACETGAVMLNGGEPVGTDVLFPSVLVDSSNLPPEGATLSEPVKPKVLTR